jgi:hypothetical protein
VSLIEMYKWGVVLTARVREQETNYFFFRQEKLFWLSCLSFFSCVRHLTRARVGSILNHQFLSTRRDLHCCVKKQPHHQTNVRVLQFRGFFFERPPPSLPVARRVPYLLIWCMKDQLLITFERFWGNLDCFFDFRV